MAGKRKPGETFDLLQEVFGTYPGSELGISLRDGASIQGTVDGEDFNLVKRGGELLISEGSVPNPDISVELNRASCEYIAQAEDLAGFVERARECIRGERNGCVFSYRYDASLPRLLMKGYMEFARAFGII